MARRVVGPGEGEREGGSVGERVEEKEGEWELLRVATRVVARGEGLPLGETLQVSGTARPALSLQPPQGQGMAAPLPAGQ